MKFSACSATAVPTLITPTTVTAAFDTVAFNRYDAEHFHLQPVAGSHRFIANSGAGPTPGLRLHLFSINDSLAVTQVTLPCFFNKEGW